MHDRFEPVSVLHALTLQWAGKRVGIQDTLFESWVPVS